VVLCHQPSCRCTDLHMLLGPHNQSASCKQHAVLLPRSNHVSQWPANDAAIQYKPELKLCFDAVTKSCSNVLITPRLCDVRCAGILASWYDPENRGSDTVAVYVADTTTADTRGLGTAQVCSRAVSCWCIILLDCSRQVVHGKHATCSSGYTWRTMMCRCTAAG
jgi:hypothetical protein